MRKFADLYKNKLMKITFTNNNAEQIFYNEIGTHIPEDYFDCKNIFIRHGLSTAFYIKNINETCIDVPEGWIIIDAWGEPVGAGGKYKKFMDLNSGVTELEATIKMDESHVCSGKYDVIYAMDNIDIALNISGQLPYSEAKDLYNMLMNIPNMEKKLCSIAGTKYSNEIEVHLDSFIRNAIEYAEIRMKWSMMSDQEAVRRNSERTMVNDSLMQRITTILLYLKSNGMDTIVDTELINCLNNRKQVGDLACYIAYERAIKAR